MKKYHFYYHNSFLIIYKQRWCVSLHFIKYNIRNVIHHLEVDKVNSSDG